ncbi:phospho-acceptor domain-containing protein [Flavobacterium sp. 90]|uniref:hybrid sensor histidine kinase/response regulator n=1 Tax=unclassified Flavobacterium TaxID=196869 RepID=UPI000EAFB641|nr:MULTISPECIES: hybrid sensor histidine kinase/response regulator [unclassified Flavobacterium]RKR08991.1 phospho-acceptor domain-containing protein [Flavobacterium sp. 81]TCK52778.1 phospho-acceptor domain-containing protein [Flavobacterium sp. 90]
MKEQIKILILEDNSSDADLILRQLYKSGMNFLSKTVETRKMFEKELENFSPDIILSDYSLPTFDAVSAFGLVKIKKLNTPFIIVSGTIGEENAVQLLKDGVTDFASKSNLMTLPQKVVRGIKEAQDSLEKKEILEKLKTQTAALIIANEELKFQNNEKEKRAIELLNANKELLAFNFISSHDLQEPLRKIQTFISRIMENEAENMSEAGKNNMERIQVSATRMRQLIEDLLAFSRVGNTAQNYEMNDLKIIIEDVKSDLKDSIKQKKATIDIIELVPVNIITFQFRQLIYNLISNALKFSRPDLAPHISIQATILNHTNSKLDGLSSKLLNCNYWNLSFKDNGIGFETEFNDLIFVMFKRLHHRDQYAGTGIGLAIVKKIIDNHNGIITAKGILNQGTTFEIFIPLL